MRRKLLLGNWKMNKTIAEAKEFALQSVRLSSLAASAEVDIGVAPTYLSLSVVKENNPSLIVAAQNCHYEDKGAFTGEISIPMLQDLGISWVLIGHSERRAYNNETNLSCNKKLLKLVAQHMVPVYCVGETLAEFEDGRTKEIVEKQLRVGLNDITPEQMKEIVIAYEPVWSIGTGKNASKEIAEDVCGFIRTTIASLHGKKVAESVRILYGGSVKPENIKSYMSMPDIDGALVGGASLTIASFEELLRNIQN